MNMISFFLARKILIGNVYQKGISTMTLICFSGIFIGSFSLALITAIMNGFEVTIHEKMQGIHSQITLRAYPQTIEMETLAPVLKKEFPEIKAFSPHATRNLLIQTQPTQEIMPLVVVAEGIDPEKEEYTSTLAQKIISPHTKNFVSLFANNNLVIGKQLALNNNLKAGDTIEILFSKSEQMHGRKITFDSQSAIIGGIFDTGIDEFDNGVIYCSLSFFEKLFSDVDIDHVSIALNPSVNERECITKLHNRLGLQAYSWKDLYPALVATLKLEKYVSFFILALIILVASMNIISLLFMQITQKRPDIALLKAIGMTNNSISSIFFLMGMIISCTASFFGLVAAYIASYLLNRFPFIELPDSYYVTHLPVAMNWHIILSVFCVVIFFSFFATWFPSQRIKSINISHVLRFEG